MPDWEFVTPVLSSRWSGVLSPFCEESATGDRSCRDSIAQTAVQAGSSVGRGFIPPSLEGLEDYWDVAGVGRGWGGMVVGVSPVTSWAPRALRGFRPILHLSGLNTHPRFVKLHGEPSFLFCRVFIRVGGWCRWISRMPIFMYRFTPVIGGIFGLLSETNRRAHPLSMEGTPLLVLPLLPEF